MAKSEWKKSLKLFINKWADTWLLRLIWQIKRVLKFYAEQVPQTIKHYGGKYIIRAGEYTSLEGKWDYTRNVIIEFPTYEKALEWYNSDLYKPVKELRQKNSEGNLIIIKGV